ncbi:FecR domain-containing protein [Sphingomonas sp. SCN 67-18]|uniref:FecR family protein n=1 Tax=uncultured Sphingomonas sp. TaxID=158754 RepID=UPI0025DC48A6|nr:FecR domain-containing protein [Sphingomonas sp. SCN 67-18]
MNDSSALHSPDPILEQAALWFQRMSDNPAAGDVAAFRRWRDADPHHAEAFAEIERAHEMVRASADSVEMLALRHETLARLVVAEPRERSRWPAFSAAVAMLFCVGIGLFAMRDGALPWLPWGAGAQAQSRVYETGAGQRLEVSLSDGSHVTLNTGSRLRTAYDDRTRTVILDRGEALFDVAKGQTRPFKVVAGDRLVTAQGTTFDVRLDTGSIKVALIEGQVTVARPADRAERIAKLRPNDVLVASAAGVMVTHDPNLIRLTSWTEGLIIFDNDALADAVREMNRYSEQDIILNGDDLKTRKISGAFRTGELETFVEALSMSFPVKVVERTDSRIVLARRQ